MAARHVVVDGSNLATEGRSTPSLAQLDQAVREFLLENPEDVVTVVVDASFGHRIDPSESEMFEEAEEANEVVSPPAGAIGRGDAFLLRIADKTGATVLSNDSFQEFHGDYEWLFERGRLIGGKPVPGVGWIFTPRTPVRGPRSREAVQEAKRKKRGDTESAIPGLDLAAERSRGKGKGKKTVERAIAVALEEVVAPKGKPRRRRAGGSPPAEPVNAPLAFITFIAAHPLGTEVTGNLESFASHGAFVEVEGARCYVPLSAMGDPPPKSAREVFGKGETATFVVQALDPQRRGVELAVPRFAKVAGAPTEETVAAEIEARLVVEPAPVKRTRKKAAAAGVKEAEAVSQSRPSETPVPAPGRARAKRTSTKKAAAGVAGSEVASTTAMAALETAGPDTAVPPASATGIGGPEAAAPKRAPAKRAPAKTAPAKRAPAKRATAKAGAAAALGAGAGAGAEEAHSGDGQGRPTDPGDSGAAAPGPEPATPAPRRRRTSSRVARPVDEVAPEPLAPSASGELFDPRPEQASPPGTPAPRRGRRAASVAPVASVAPAVPAAPVTPVGEEADQAAPSESPTRRRRPSSRKAMASPKASEPVAVEPVAVEPVAVEAGGVPPATKASKRAGGARAEPAPRMAATKSPAQVARSASAERRENGATTSFEAAGRTPRVKRAAKAAGSPTGSGAATAAGSGAPATADAEPVRPRRSSRSAAAKATTTEPVGLAVAPAVATPRKRGGRSAATAGFADPVEPGVKAKRQPRVAAAKGGRSRAGLAGPTDGGHPGT